MDLRSSEVEPGTLAAWSRHLGATVTDPQALRARLGQGSLPAAFAVSSARRPSRPALTIGGASATHGELDRLAALVGGGLRARGVGPGTAVLLVAATSLDVVVAYLGILRSGAAVVLANPAYHPAELSLLIEDSGATVAVAGGGELQRIAGANAGVEMAIGLGAEDRGAADVVLHDLIARADPIVPPELDPDAPALFAYTSGTTGRPKCTPLSHRNLLASIRGAMWAWRWSEEDVLVHALPLSHQHGLGGVHATLLAASRAALVPRFDVGGLVEGLQRERATVLFAVPAIYRRLVSELDTGDWGAFHGLRLMISGSAPLPATLAEEVRARSGRLPLERYGLTETGLDVSTPYDGPNRPGMVGLPLPGVEMALVDAGLNPVDMGMTGEVLFRGPQVFPGYRSDPDTTTAAFVGQWFRTGDLGVVDQGTGYLTLVGRTKDVIITGGLNVYPREVELALLSLPGVVDAAVIGVPSERWGEEVVAFVVPASGAEFEAVSIPPQLPLAPFKRPKRVLVTDDIPRDDVGKVARKALLARMADPGDPHLKSGI